jgi:hypothetical protein
MNNLCSETANGHEFLVHKMHDVRFEVFTVVSMKNGIFWDVMPCCKNRCLGGKYHLHHLDDKNRRAGNNISSK